ncbi:MAG: bis(5'-nucleosyl)-tetraphosphatase (symmetrical) YqeK [Sporomusaceae bacterium]|nr:bis(5'-nucleosyl)-tetraphosphatase (symmetrical) YqeK [Sporomusaceae bacterium]
MTLQQIRQNLKTRLSARRFEHTIGVSETAAHLAGRYGADVDKARLAGLLHDCAREMPRNTLLRTAEAFGIVVGRIERRELALLHAPIGAHLAQTVYGVSDREIIDAIASHTVGGPNLSLLSMIVYLADYIEPTRSFPGVDKLRSLAANDLNAAMLESYDHSINYIISRGGLIHPATVEGRNELLLRRDS